MDLNTIVNELKEQANLSQQQEKKEKKKETASSIFDDFFDFAQTQDLQESQQKKEDVEEPSQEKKIEQQFEESYDSLFTYIRDKGESALGINKETMTQLLVFIKKFKVVFKKEFYSDALASYLLREIFFETEYVKLQEQNKEEEKHEVRELNMMEIVNKIKAEDKQTQFSLENVRDWNSFKVCAALHSENQDVIFNELQERFDFENNLSWDLMKKICIPVWLKEHFKLKSLIEQVAKAEYRLAADEFDKVSRAERSAPWYIMIGKKNILCTLYKAEPAYKKVHDLLMNDFSQQRWRTSAEKNAMVLMSKRNYMLAITFFLLARNLKSAVQIALNRLNDPILAILMCRIYEGDDCEILREIYDEWFIQRGQTLGDLFLINIGRWQRKEYLQALNQFQIEIDQTKNTDQMFNNEKDIFNLVKGKVQVYKSEKNALPLPSKDNYLILDFIKALKKSSVIKKQLNKNWALDQSAGGSIFDDFFGSSQPQQQKQNEKKEEESKLSLDEGKVLTVIAHDAWQSGLTLLALIAVYDNQEYIANMEIKYKERIAYGLLVDMVYTIKHQTDISDSVTKLNQSIALIVEKFEVKHKLLKDFVFRQLALNDLFILKISFGMEDMRQNVMYSLEDEIMKLLDFIYSFTDFPFIMDITTKNDLHLKVIPLIGFLEQVIDCLIMYDFQSPTQKSAKNYKPNQENKEGTKVAMSVSSIDNEEENYQFNLDEAKGPLTLKNLDVANKLLSSKDIGVSQEIDTILQNISTKIRTTLLVYLALIQLSYATKKFTIVQDLIVDLRSLLKSKLNQSNDNTLETGVKIDFQKLKIKIQKFKQDLNQSAQNEQQENINTNTNGSSPQQRKETDIDQKKVSAFLTLWIRYIVAFNTQQIIKSCYKETQIQNFINVRPAIINIRSLPEVIEVLMNPRLKAKEINSKFLNMHRILQNVLTYYFEKVINSHERQILSKELVQLEREGFKRNSKNLDFLPMFLTNQKFTKFAEFMQLKEFIKHLRDHELSIVYHMNFNYSQDTVERVQELFQHGIEIFKQKGESISQFAFDCCGLDLVSIGLLNKGIREIPVQKALQFRNRQHNGRELFDEELQTWYECLHRYDTYSQVHSDLRAKDEPLIAAIDKLYHYKTINYAMKARREKRTLFLDYELLSPDIWANQKSIEFLRQQSNQDITHDDYSYAIESHPFLPLYASGNSRGFINLWGYDQQYDKSIDQFVTELDQKQTNPKKTTIRKIQFNNFGDKLTCNNMDGCVYMFKFDTLEHSKLQPIYTIQRTKEIKFADFEILNHDTILTMTSLKPKQTWIHDTLIPQRNGLVMEYQAGGNIIQQNRNRQQIYTFNEKPGQMSVLDLRMNKIMQTVQLSNEEITAVCTNESQDTLIAGFKDGNVKIMNVDKEFEQREFYSAFPAQGGRKTAVSALRVHPSNGALFASSQNGILKLFRTKI